MSTLLSLKTSFEKQYPCPVLWILSIPSYEVFCCRSLSAFTGNYLTFTSLILFRKHVNALSSVCQSLNLFRILSLSSFLSFITFPPFSFAPCHFYLSASHLSSCPDDKTKANRESHALYFVFFTFLLLFFPDVYNLHATYDFPKTCRRYHSPAMPLQSLKFLSWW